eukprot:TRINITY_DN137_c0_g1_i1.p1 TRINITY_DN137_c0_g1~~TRINITY_DN137_c0_g1_i1.p1  ORF type:complete len:206 (+),score=34.04 TRINITY_DN137_c0_g1_i1:173-790(+)
MNRLTTTQPLEAWTGGMELADMTIGEFDTANPTKQIARDYWSATYGRPQLDTALGGRDNVVFVSGSSDASSTVYEFERPLAASDTYDKAIRSGSMSVVYAHGNYSQPQLLKHPNAYRARAVVDFFASGSCPNDCSGRGACDVSSNTCICDAGAIGADCSGDFDYLREEKLSDTMTMAWTISQESILAELTVQSEVLPTSVPVPST